MALEQGAPRALARRVKTLAREEGFDLVRIAPAGDLHQARARYLAWLAAGRQGDMRWMTPERAARSASPAASVPDARSVITLGLGYFRGEPSRRPGYGRVARYAWGRDYHDVVGSMLRRLAGRIEAEVGGAWTRFVDTGPAMDKAFAAAAGLGWYGKNTNILTPALGSWVLLGEIITDLALEPDAPLTQNCGSCCLCQIACPTGALDVDYSIDARRCISYLTIEHRGPIPLELRPAIGSWVFGCDICQEVCPPTMRPYLTTAADTRRWAERVRVEVRAARGRHLPAAAATARPVAGDTAGDIPPDSHRLGNDSHADLDLVWLLTLTHQQYLDAFRGTAIRRAKVWMLRRNAAVALGNVGDDHHVAPLAAALALDEHPLVRGHAAWALGRLAQRHAADDAGIHLRKALSAEPDASVTDEISRALETAKGARAVPAAAEHADAARDRSGLSR